GGAARPGAGRREASVEERRLFRVVRSHGTSQNGLLLLYRLVPGLSRSGGFHGRTVERRAHHRRALQQPFVLQQPQGKQPAGSSRPRTRSETPAGPLPAGGGSGGRGRPLDLPLSRRAVPPAPDVGEG